MMPGHEQSSYYYGKGSHTSLGAGLMVFPFLKRGGATLYSPFRVYLSANGGLAYQSNETVDVINLPGGFTVFDQGKVLPYAKGLVGEKFE